ncbi:helix-turn-helix transcriptional regulator [Brevibacterium spongiae]|uniref:LuxR C-terminal-related transcriptional regulator n=1 Tax=Brevibacterium spongiae TaxID=2909672 RepID=A0ABY5SQ19_9MICO|nr:LuxR C-terminal-related transcriptional regulator [Brevibacterium spongiae]UVI36657.1 LuxR C-terminal-related transcriptional regulator [Brevibacterium spongiae]
MRFQRPHPSKTPLAQSLFAIADRAAHAANPSGSPSSENAAAPPQAPELLLLDACYAVATGDLERASLLVTRARADVTGARWLNLATQLDIITNGQDPEHMVDQIIDDVVSGHGELSDLVLLRRHAVLTDSHLRRLPESARARIMSIPEVRTDERIRPTLTPRENEVLDGLREGLTRRQIAEKQFRSENTVRSQVRSLYQKLGAATLDEALEAARRWGL